MMPLPRAKGTAPGSVGHAGPPVERARPPEDQGTDPAAVSPAGSLVTDPPAPRWCAYHRDRFDRAPGGCRSHCQTHEMDARGWRRVYYLAPDGTRELVWEGTFTDWFNLPEGSRP